MKRSITIQNANLTDNKLLLEVDQLIEGLIPEGQILVDSEKYSFIYLMEDQEDYTYIILPEQIWVNLKTSFEQKIPVWLRGNDKEIELINFHDELEYVINNIKGNSNYGQEMVAKVESIF
ncbi:hypothetical protein [Neobacillus bataviensis]|uniref:UPF0738 family protein n=1 Tax=Neobacillus bataviensis TaxID=220685 RepID=UPI001CBEC10B|nr:hypothetical protein [Neobacillus bataviensis]